MAILCRAAKNSLRGTPPTPPSVTVIIWPFKFIHTKKYKNDNAQLPQQAIDKNTLGSGHNIRRKLIIHLRYKGKIKPNKSSLKPVCQSFIIKIVWLPF